MPKGPIRRGQLIAPFGVGALVVVRDGMSLIGAGLDHWFEPEGGDNYEVDLNEFVIEEWRLQKLLRVSGFRLPPDFRTKTWAGNAPNLYLTIPFLRFPQWHFCPSCRLLHKVPLSARSKEICPECEKKGKRKNLIQVPFVAMCDRGHLQDFPWREWVHRSSEPSCKGRMYLVSTGGTTLASQLVKCECGVEPRSLAGITSGSSEDNESYLSSHLDEEGQPFLCQGKRPWLGTEDSEPCDRLLRGSLRSASNLYFANVMSAIYLPRSSDKAPSDLVALLDEPPLSTLIQIISGTDREVQPDELRGQHYHLLREYSDDQVKAGLQLIASEVSDYSEDKTVQGEGWQTIRHAEYEALRTPRTDDQLLIKEADMRVYEPEIIRKFSRIMLVQKLRETRVLAGFTRVMPANDQTLDQRKALLWAHLPIRERDWLPGYIVFGEGIFIDFSEEELKRWEQLVAVHDRVAPLLARDKTISPRFILIHTFAHLFMNQLTFECGYSSAALRERLFVSDDCINPMGGVLIYTAAGDAEGTMGGLVRMGKPGYFEPVVRRALEKARWCSSDPVCMEIGAKGQGPKSLNLAACHNCALVPETACENFNHFLDRALVIGDLRNHGLGYFEHTEDTN